VFSSRSLIRTLAVAEKSLFDPEIICDIDGRFFPANVRRLELFIGCKWGSYFIECPAEKSPEKFYLRGDNSLKHEVVILYFNFYRILDSIDQAANEETRICCLLFPDVLF
jgi:hypothetical protein